MKNIIRILIILVVFLSACNSNKQENNVNEKKLYKESNKQTFKAKRDLDEIIKDGKIKALITYSGSSYFLYRGQPMGYNYEMIKRFADYLDVELEIHVSTNIDNLLSELIIGDVDIVAHEMTITLERSQVVSFTDYLYLTRQVLIQKKPENWRDMTLEQIQKSIIQDPLELIGDTVSVRKNSSFFERLNNLSKEMGGKIIIDTLKGNLSTDEIIKMVVDDKIKYTIADKNLADINASYYHILYTDVPISFSQRIAWAVRPNSNKLLEAANNWIKEEKQGIDFYVIYNKYFKNKRSFSKRIRSDFYSLNKNQISKYDKIIKENAEIIEWDWRLLASLIYQESGFNPNVKSWVGAVGIMQMMPATAKELGVKNPLDVNENIKGGAKYLKQLFDNFETIKDSVQRIKFTMASYNCGYYHVRDAQKLASINGLDKNIWDENVDKMIIALTYPQNYNNKVVKFGYVRGTEPFNYVKHIFERYEHYMNFIDIDL